MPHLSEPGRAAAHRTRRDRGVRVSGAYPDRLQRRVQPPAPDPRAGPGGGPHQGPRRPARARPRHGSPALPRQHRRDGGGVPGHERGLRPHLRREPRRGADAGRGRPARGRARRAVRLRRSGPLRPGRLQPDRAPRPGQVRPPELESRAGRREQPRPLQVREFRQGDLRRQRYQGGAALGGALRRPDLGSADQRPDRGRARGHQPHLRLPAAARPRGDHAEQGPLDGRGRSVHRPGPAGQLEGLYRRRPALALQAAGPSGGSTTRSSCIPSTRRRSRPASTPSASTRACCPRTTRSPGPRPGSTTPCGTWGRRRRTGRR